MTPDDLRTCLNRLGWTTHGLAEQAAVSPTTARRWLSGQAPVPPDVARTLEQMAALAETLARKPG